MAKHKHDSEEESEEYNSEEYEDSPKSKAKAKKQTVVKSKPKAESSSSNKKRKSAAIVEESDSGAEANQETNGGVTIRSDADGNKYVELGKKRRGTVRSFKGSTFLDIREFYEASGESKPGKKGITLSQEQWELLKKCQSDIDKMFASAKSK
ncbi:PC4-domain-containing protein [Pluteus cervinus]|uniref:PC4-domain-containing protein n=1 Tax=Pluteus cervinus TaxID=181527 RepID=A0ACD3BBX7_9AGAR|nr:PC4-domain-containing protein [Pluteus cervinus]